MLCPYILVKQWRRRMSKSYLELMQLPTFEERYEYLKTNSAVGVSTFGGARYLNQKFYKSDAWKSVCRDVILRDKNCDLGIEGLEIKGPVYVHHINPITRQDVLDRAPCLLDKNNLICTSFRTHQAIHYGDIDQARTKLVERAPNDTCPWKNVGKDIL